MREEYKRENHKSYLTVKEIYLENGSEDEDYGLKMICENDVEGLLPISIHIFNGEKELYYDISTKQPLQILYEKREMGKADLEKLFWGLESAIKNMEKFLLDTDYLVMDSKHIYIGATDEKVYLMFYPYEKEGFEEKIYEFAEYILARVCNEDEKAVMYAYEFYRYIKEEKGDISEALLRIRQEIPVQQEKEEVHILEEAPDFYLDDTDFETGETSEPLPSNKEIGKDNEKLMRAVFFLVLGLGGIGMFIYSVWKYQLRAETVFSETESIAAAGMCTVSVLGMLLFEGVDYFRGRNCLKERREKKEQEKIEKGEEPEKNRITTDKGDDVDFSLLSGVWQETEFDVEQEVEEKQEEAYETVLLQENCYQEQRILTGRVKGRMRQIDLSTFPFVIGKNKEAADYVLEDHTVSRIHARFTLREDIVYLTDLNSTNGTSKNGVRLEPNEMVMLEADDEITIGRITFTYH